MRPENSYAVRMTARQRKETYFPELEGEQRRLADEWLGEYLRLILRIVKDRRGRAAFDICPQPALDDNSGTGKVRTPKATDPPLGLPK